MPSLENSKRALYKATYVPLRIKDNTGSQDNPPSNQPKTGRALEKVAYLRSLSMQPREFAALKESETTTRLLAQPSAGAMASSQARGFVQPMPLLDLVQKVTTDISPVALQNYGPLLATVSGDELAALGSSLADLRRQAAENIRAKIDEMTLLYQQALLLSAPLILGVSTFMDVLEWAQKNASAQFQDLYTLALTFAPNWPALSFIQPIKFINWAVSYLATIYTDTTALIDSFLASQAIEPVGWLHLERLEMTPVGVEHGELLHSVPLTPKETVNLTHREWSVTSKTFEDMVQDYFEGFSETGVAEKTDLTQATDTETRHTSALDISGNVSASYNGAGYSVSASASTNYHTTSDDFHSIKVSQAHSQAITRTASARTKRDHKISFRVSSVAGAEDLSVRVLTNPSDTNAMRVDYFQLLRKWRVDLIRYGLRMTYDLVVPNPGHDLFGPVYEIQLLNQAIETAFSFAVPLSDITPDTWIQKAQEYNTEVDAPPKDREYIVQSKKIGGELDKIWTDSIDLEVPDDYEIEEDADNTQLIASLHLNNWNADNKGRHPSFSIVNSGQEDIEDPTLTYDSNNNAYLHQDVRWVDHLSDLWGKSGKISVAYWWLNCDSGEVVVKLQSRLKDVVKNAWQLKVWSQLRAAALATYNQRVEAMKERKAKLESELTQWDALTLRKMEREEIMKCVLRWLLGPTFEQVLEDINFLLPAYTLTDPNELIFFQNLTKQNRQTIMQYGEFIKFIHNAIEWENVVFFAYPYFWDATKNWPFKQFLIHPDLEHREFLRAGSARVVLTIRPGFEHDFAALAEGGSPQINLQDHPYVTIGEEIRHFAMTNYEGIPPANPDQNVRLLLYPEQRKAWKDMQVIMRLLEEYSEVHQPTVNLDPSWPGTLWEDTAHDSDVHDPNAKVIVKVYPTTKSATGESLWTALQDPSDIWTALKPFATQHKIASPPIDPWGRYYQYRSPGIYGEYDLVCYGKNGVEGVPPDGTDLDADITSWAEGSVVARWHEYTPTSAMDVSINTVLPTTPQPA